MPRTGVAAKALALAGIVLTALFAGACSRPVPPDPRAEAGRVTVSGEITVFAASSLTEAFREIGAGFEAANPGTRLNLNFGGSSTLRAQLEQGARADVFASADEVQMSLAVKAGVTASDPAVFARNRLVIVTPRGNPRQIASLEDLGRPGVKLLLTAPGVPIGQYTLDLFDRAARAPGFGTDFRARAEANVVSREENVRQLVAKVQLGEADAGVCYATDVTPSVRDQLTVIQIPDGLQVSSAYPLAPTRGSNPVGGQAFAAYVLSPAGQAVLQRWGFLPP
ncbi:MAG: molybdate ABC transporter substrate-binding protein [Chloroflexi bacterium]|nr:molybdate ABC transporter substrate-binding protein [Chloroflexota bacterium]